MEENKILVSPVNPSGYSTNLGTISVSNVYSSSYPGYYAFNETSGYWCTSASVSSAWLQIEYKTPIRINAFEYLADYDSGYPYSLNFEGSQNGTSWDILYTADDIPVGKIEGSFKNKTEYKFYRLNITRKRNSYITARGLKFFQYPLDNNIYFNKVLKSNLSNKDFDGVPFVFTEDGDLYGIKENELKSIINPTKLYTQNILFNSDITTDNTGQLSMDINDYDFLYFYLQGSGDKRSLMPDDMNSNSEQGYNLTASSTIQGYDYIDIYGMFNYDYTSAGGPWGWYSIAGQPFPQWFMVEFPSPVKLNIWDYQTYYSGERRPTNITVQASDDGQIFIDLLKDYVVDTSEQTQFFTIEIPNNNKYKFYKFIINSLTSNEKDGTCQKITHLYEEIKDNDNSSYLIPKELFNKNISSFNFANLSVSNTNLNITNVKKPFNLQIIGVKKGV